MSKRPKNDSAPLQIGDATIKIGETRNIGLVASQSASGQVIEVPITVRRAAEPGPTVFVSAAIHGDELNGTGVIRELIMRSPFELKRGTLIMVPVVNILGFERHMRYLPDRRDLNRSFPGSDGGSLAARFARTIYSQIVQQCDFGIDLHTAAVRRTNYPNVRGHLGNAGVDRIARAFGAELIINGKGPRGSLRRTATNTGCPTIILEAGEVWKIEPSVVAIGTQGVRNVMIELEMTDGEPIRPVFQAFADEAVWVRSDYGGILEFHVAPGEIVDKGAAIATNSSLTGDEQNVLTSPVAGVVLGLTTIPAVTPGDAVCNIAVPRDGLKQIRKALKNVSDTSLHARLRDDLATNVTVSDRVEED